MGGIKFVLALIVGGITVGTASLIWPRFTPQPRPSPLEEVYDVVMTTQIGQNMAQVLGVSDEEHVEAVNIASLAGGLMSAAVSATEKKAQSVVVHQAVQQLVGQFDKLPTEEKKEIQQLICKP